LYKRYDAKRGKTPPVGFEPAQDPDVVTGHWPGWIPVGDGPEDRWHRMVCGGESPDGTYELIGPKINGNAEHVPSYVLMRHGDMRYENAPRTFEALKRWLSESCIEGLVWHHPDGRMVKVKARDFGLMWPR